MPLLTYVYTMPLVLGQNVIISEYVEILDAYVLYGCARSISIQLETSMIETAVSGSQGWATQRPARHSFTGAMNGLVNLEEENLISIADLRAKQIARTKLRLMIQRTAIDGITVYSEEADFYITNSSDESALNQVATFDISFIGTGELEQNYTPGEILANVKRIEYTGVGGEDEINLPITIGKRILAVHKDGIGSAEFIIAGTPVDKQVFINSVGIENGQPLNIDGKFKFAVPFEPNEIAYVLYR